MRSEAMMLWFVSPSLITISSSAFDRVFSSAASEPVSYVVASRSSGVRGSTLNNRTSSSRCQWGMRSCCRAMSFTLNPKILSTNWIHTNVNLQFIHQNTLLIEMWKSDLRKSSQCRLCTGNKPLKKLKISAVWTKYGCGQRRWNSILDPPTTSLQRK